MRAGAKRSWGKILLFYVLTALISLPFWALDTRAPDNLTLITGNMWAPGLAAIATQWLFGESVGELGWRWGKGHLQAWGYVLPFLYGIPAYAVIWLLGGGALGNAQFLQDTAHRFGLGGLPTALQASAYVVIALTAGFIAKSGRALGEEIGWRGLLVPELGKVMSPLGAAVVSGLMWSLWHFPSILWSDYNSGAPAWYSICCFTVMTTAVGVMAARLTFAARSLWPAVVLHGAHNTLIQLVLTPFTTDTGHTVYYVDEFGIGLALGATVMAAVVWRICPLRSDGPLS
jgi:membrane protease YdiL (CAAX protease family)